MLSACGLADSQTSEQCGKRQTPYPGAHDTEAAVTTTACRASGGSSKRGQHRGTHRHQGAISVRAVTAVAVATRFVNTFTAPHVAVCTRFVHTCTTSGFKDTLGLVVRVVHSMFPGASPPNGPAATFVRAVKNQLRLINEPRGSERSWPTNMCQRRLSCLTVCQESS